MATEVGLITLDALGLYCIHMKEFLLDKRGDNPFMNKIFDILLSFLQVGQSETLFRHVFAALRALINNFSTVLFQGDLSKIFVLWRPCFMIQVFNSIKMCT